MDYIEDGMSKVINTCFRNLIHYQPLMNKYNLFNKVNQFKIKYVPLTGKYQNADKSLHHGVIYIGKKNWNDNRSIKHQQDHG